MADAAADCLVGVAVVAVLCLADLAVDCYFLLDYFAVAAAVDCRHRALVHCVVDLGFVLAVAATEAILHFQIAEAVGLDLFFQEHGVDFVLYLFFFGCFFPNCEDLSDLPHLQILVLFLFA